MADEKPRFDTCLLGRDDLDRFRDLLNVFGEAFEEEALYASAPPSDDYLRDLLSQPEFVAVVALDDEQVIGGLTAYELKKYEQERSEFYLYDLAVASPYRRQGAATAVINHLKATAKKMGAYVIFVQADYGDDPATALYTKLGVREDVLHFDLKLAE